MKLKNRLAYLRSAGRALAQRPNWTTMAFALRYARRCLQVYEGPKPDFLSEPKPWMCFPAIEQLERLLTRQSRVFEYGSGGSTIYFAQRAAEVVSIEHEPSWYQRVGAELERQQLTNVRYQLIEPVADAGFDASRIADPSAYVSDDPDYTGKTFRSYAQAIDNFPDRYFDLVVVDGRARPSCISHALEKVRPNGVLLLDQSERPYYLAKQLELLDPTRWRRARYLAPQAHYLHFTEATFFTRRYP